MSECDEIAQTMRPRWLEFVATAPAVNLDTAELFVRSRMPDESAVVISNVAYALLRGSK